MDLIAQFDGPACERVNRAVAAAEAKTRAEILPVVARSSGRYERAADLVGLWFGWIAAGVAWWLFQGIGPSGSWDGTLGLRLGFWVIVGIFLAGFIAGVVVADRVPRLRQLFVSRREIEERIIASAKSVFFDRRVHRTSGGTGILLFLSVLERRVAVLADDAIADQLSEKALEEIRDEVIAGLRDGGIADGLVRGADRVGNLLGAALPAGDERIDEVPSEVVVLG